MMRLVSDAPTYDVTVVGDEVESILTAVSASLCGAKTLLIKPRPGLLGGLSTRGGLSYMDITPEHKSPLFTRFLNRAGVTRVALDPLSANTTLADMMSEADVSLLVGEEPIAEQESGSHAWRLDFGNDRVVVTRILIDATPDANIARQLGIPYTVGLGGLFGDDHNFLGVSPVFRMDNVPRLALMDFEARLRALPQMAEWLEIALPHHSAEFRQELLSRPVFSPNDMDYIDILNPAIGIAFHHWRHGDVGSYPTANILVDGFNISCLPDESLGFNGLVMRVNHFDELLKYSQGGQEWPKPLTDTMEAFEQFLAKEPGLSQAVLLHPDELYVRQTLNVLSRQPMTAELAVRGGVLADEAIGTYSYWLDLRGIVFSEHFPGEVLPKPVFNVGLGAALPANNHPGNFAVIGRSAGYSPLGQGACRIVQHNAMLGEAVGIAAALATQQQVPLNVISAGAIRQVLAHRYNGPVPICGKPTWTAEQIVNSKALKADSAIVERLAGSAVY